MLKSYAIMAAALVWLASTAPAQPSWTIPSCAWSIPLGSTADPRGIPVGGIGAGAVMYNFRGTFGPWDLAPSGNSANGFKTSGYDANRSLNAAFHLYEKRRGQAATVKTLATEGPAGWNLLTASSATYRALYPKAWVTYTGTTLQVTLKLFSPIIARNYKETSYPAGCFQFRVQNTTADTVDASFMFTFPNKAIPNGTLGAANAAQTGSGVTGVTMSQGWCLAAPQIAGATVSYVTSWSGAAGIYSAFSDDGVLGNGSLNAGDSAGAVAVKITLAPGAAAVVPFVLAWDAPKVKFNTGTEWYRRYTEYFNKNGGNALAIAREAAANLAAWETQVDGWWNLVVNETAYPDWLKQGALNELYYGVFGDVLWENGCVTKPLESPWSDLPATDHKYATLECKQYPMYETFDVRHYECRHLLELWPDIERDVLKWYSRQSQNSGMTMHDLGSDDPYFEGAGSWFDHPNRFLQQVYAYYFRTKDKAFLDFAWAGCKKVYTFIKTMDTDGNGLLDKSDGYDFGTAFESQNIFGDGLWVGAVEAMEKMAEAEGDNATRTDAAALLVRIKPLIDSLYWVPADQFYRMDRVGNFMYADQMCGQRYTESCSLSTIFPAARLGQHWKKAYNLAVKPMPDFTGDGNGDVGQVSAVTAAGAVIPGPKTGPGTFYYGNEVWSGITYFSAAMMYHSGTVLNDSTLKANALQTAFGAYYQTWVRTQNGYHFNTPEAWMAATPSTFRAICYQRPRAIWELLLEIKNPFRTMTVGIEGKVKDEVKVEGMQLEARPNPFTMATVLQFTVHGSRSTVNLSMFNLSGKCVATLVNGTASHGLHTVSWNASAMPAGVYMARLSTGERVLAKRIMLVK